MNSTKNCFSGRNRGLCGIGGWISLHCAMTQEPQVQLLQVQASSNWSLSEKVFLQLVKGCGFLK